MTNVKVYKVMKSKSKMAYAALFALTVSMMTPAVARADAISDAITSFDTTNIMAAGAAVIGLVIAIVGVKKVIQMVKGA
ncbi:hypothetical protein C4J81_00350 [Deltaproteobacteria bacterium Smac51]|nr:hypothetical protein C4J81_00270 [Deltaproteobacteria bacterium Smac51]UQZ87749.1 hypothetical protein C4J81_00350 [Deltaproteobacteria bacterium Smac51]